MKHIVGECVTSFKKRDWQQASPGTPGKADLELCLLHLGTAENMTLKQISALMIISCHGETASSCEIQKIAES